MFDFFLVYVLWKCFPLSFLMHVRVCVRVCVRWTGDAQNLEGKLLVVEYSKNPSGQKGRRGERGAGGGAFGYGSSESSDYDSARGGARPPMRGRGGAPQAPTAEDLYMAAARAYGKIRALSLSLSLSLSLTVLLSLSPLSVCLVYFCFFRPHTRNA